MRESGETSVKIKVRDALVGARNSSIALKEIYQLKKQLNRNLSYAFLAQRLAQKSRGYVADLVNGKRPVPKRLASPLVSALGLEPVAQEYFISLVAREHARSPEQESEWQNELDRLKKLISMNRTTESDVKFSDVYFTFELFCTISLFKNGCTRARLNEYFGPGREEVVETAVAQLLEAGSIEDRGGVLVQKDKHIKLFGENRLVEVVHFLHESLRQTHSVLFKWFQRPKESFFDSTIISVRKADYEKYLPLLAKTMQKMKSDLENDEADQLIRFNVQIFPLARGD
jgi:uncharacterized protein (TIGR02147 family)